MLGGEKGESLDKEHPNSIQMGKSSLLSFKGITESLDKEHPNSIQMGKSSLLSFKGITCLLSTGTLEFAIKLGIMISKRWGMNSIGTEC